MKQVISECQVVRNYGPEPHAGINCCEMRRWLEHVVARPITKETSRQIINSVVVTTPDPFSEEEDEDDDEEEELNDARQAEVDSDEEGNPNDWRPNELNRDEWNRNIWINEVDRFVEME